VDLPELLNSQANRDDSTLHADLFLRDLGSALLVVDQLDAGGVILNDFSDFRFVTCELLLDGK
jgi:hypothetical protein